MLVLSRKLGQRFEVGGDIRITVVKIDRNSIRIGIEAPGDVCVRREEIAELDRAALIAEPSAVVDVACPA